MYCDKDDILDNEMQSCDDVVRSIILGRKSLVVHVKWRRQRWWVEGLCMEVLLMAMTSSSSCSLLAKTSSFAMLSWVERSHWSVERRTRWSIVLVLIIAWIVVRV